MAKRYDTAAPLAGKDISLRGEGIKLHIPDDLKPPPEAQRVSHSDGKSADAATVIVILVFDILVGLVVFAGFHWLGDVDAGVAFVIALFVLFVATVITVAFLSGQLPALYEVFADMLVNRRRVAAVRDISLAQVAVYDKLAEAQLTDAEARLLEAKTSDKQLALALADKPAAQAVANQLETYVAAEPPADNLREDMKAWIADVVGDGASVDADGKILIGVPWSTNGELSPSERERVKEWFRVANSAARGGWVIDLRRNAWRVNLEEYPDAAQVVAQLATVPMPRRK